jgi:hypothetical protein
MTIYELNLEIKEGLFDFLSSKKKNNNQSNKNISSNQSNKFQDISGEPIFPECKYKNGIIVGSKYKGMDILGSKNEEDILINILGNLFVTNWVKVGEKCLKKILSYLIAKYISEEEIEGEDEIDLEPIIRSLEKNSNELDLTQNDKNKYSKAEIKVLEKIYDRILYHRDSLFNDFFRNPKEFKNGWNEVKNKIITTIENILKTRGDALMHVGMHYSKKADQKQRN